MKRDSSQDLEKSYFDVLGLCCSSEVQLIEKILKPLDGVHHVSVIVPSRTVIVLHDTDLISQFQIVKALNQARLEANVRMKGDQSYRNKWPSPSAVVCGVLLLLSFLKYVYPPFKWLALGAVAVGVFPLILKAIASLRNFRFDINLLMLIAVGGSIFLKDYWEAATIVFLLTISEWLERRATHKATAVMSSLISIAPDKAVLAETGEEVNANEVMVNTRIAVKAGTMIPIDGVVVEGNCEVDEKTLTGESFPVCKQVDSVVWAGTLNLNGYISIKTTALAEACVVARMAKLVEEAQNNKSKTQRYVDKIAKYYTPAVCVVAASLAAIPAAMQVHDLQKWYHLALVVLVSACPCALILSTPVAAFCALSKAATSGLLVKGAEYLEILSTLKYICFDKTGTITKGEFSVSNFHPLIDNHRLLYWVSSIESKSSHPMAAALVDYAQSHSIEPQADNVEEFKDFPGEGIYGKIDGKDVYIGNQKIAIRAGCLQVPKHASENNEGKSVGYVFLGSTPAGIFSLSDSCRIGVKEALEELKSMGIKTAMLTGDCQAAANHAQNQLGGALEVVHAELLPQDKAKIIKEIQKKFSIGMVGDGLNDAPALATADIGISMGVSGSALANETGHVILMSNDIRKIPIAVKLARKTRRKIFENIFIAMITKAAIIALAIAGHPLVWAAVLADVGTCLLVIFNSMLLLQGTTSRSMKKYSNSENTNAQCISAGTKIQKQGDCCGPNRNVTNVQDGCCGPNRINVQELKHLVQKTKENESCCAPNHNEQGGGCGPNRNVQELKHLEQETKENESCCAPNRNVQGGCCGPSRNVQELKLLVQETKENESCCAPNRNGQELKHLVQETKENESSCAHDQHNVLQNEDNDGCCVRDDHVHEVNPHCIQETKDDCCATGVNNVHDVKHVAQPEKGKEKHGCCANDVGDVHDVKYVEQPKQRKETHGCCARDSIEVRDVKHMEQPEKRIEKQGCCADDDDDEIHLVQPQQAAPNVLTSRHLVQETKCCNVGKDLESQICGNSVNQSNNVKEYITEEELGKVVKNCCRSRGLKKRNVSGCCKSFTSYKCCGNQYFGGGYNRKGYLSEIVIE